MDTGSSFRRSSSKVEHKEYYSVLNLDMGTGLSTTMPADYADKPTSEWEYSHALTDGDTIITKETNMKWKVTTVKENGSVHVVRDSPFRPNLRDIWSEKMTTTGLANGDIETESGLSHELATF